MNFSASGPVVGPAGILLAGLALVLLTTLLAPRLSGLQLWMAWAVAALGALGLLLLRVYVELRAVGDGVGADRPSAALLGAMMVTTAVLTIVVAIIPSAPAVFLAGRLARRGTARRLAWGIAAYLATILVLVGSYVFWLSTMPRGGHPV